MPFLEIILDAIELRASGILSRDEIEDPLEEALARSGTAEVTGGGGGGEHYNIDVEVRSEANLDAVIDAIRQVLRHQGVPKSTFIRLDTPPKTFAVY